MDPEMSSEAFVSVNVPTSVSSILLNIFFVFCMIFPQQGTEKPKQPLKALLGSLVGCNISAHACILVMVFNNYFNLFILWWYMSSIAIYIMMISINFSHWLNIFYCFQIIPVQRPFFIWFKRNIRVFIYCAVLINIAVCLLGMSVNVLVMTVSSNNVTDLTAIFVSDRVMFWTTLGLYFLSFCVMLASSCVTVVFLWRHMKNMEKSSDSFFSPCRQRQIRVTIISIIVQALLHLTCSALVIIDEIIIVVSIINFDMDFKILCTVISLYSFGTTINLGMSQSVFRQRTAYVWLKCFRPCRFFSASTTAQTFLSNVYNK